MKHPLLSIALLLSLSLGVLLGGAYWMLNQAVSADVAAETSYIDLVLRDRVLLFSEMLKRRYASDEINYKGTQQDIPHWVARGFAPLNPDVFLQAWNRDGKPIGNTLNISQPLALSEAARAEITAAIQTNEIRHVVESRTLPDGRGVKLTTYPLYERNPTNKQIAVVGFAAAGLPVPQVSHRLARVAWVLGSTGIAVLGITLVATAFFLRRMKLAVEVEEVRQRRQMADFVADAAHELNSPLTVLRGEIDLALRRERVAEDYRAALQVCREETERLSRLAAHLLQLASADAGQSLLALDKIDLAQLCRELAERWQSQATERGISLTCEGPASLWLHADAAAMERIWHNLLDNAFRHTSRGGSIQISLAHRNSEALLCVSDSGEGIPEAHVPKIFQRFYRVDKARSRAQGGAGLGLAIVKALVEAHGGKITVTSKLGKGTKFAMVFPVDLNQPGR